MILEIINSGVSVLNNGIYHLCCQIIQTFTNGNGIDTSLCFAGVGR